MEVFCYECNKPGQLKYDCPKCKKDKRKKKGLLATWDGSNSSEDESLDGYANMALMAEVGISDVTFSPKEEKDQDLDINEVVSKVVFSDFSN